jgi:raffinose/stachyose/melibiose transport system permease protein
MSALPAKLRLRPLEAWRSASAKTREQWLLASVLVAPALILMGVIVFYPTFQTVGLSFYKWDGISPDMGDFVGFKTYARATGNYPFSQAIKNSILWGVVGLFVPTTIGLVAAALVEDTNLRLKPLFRFAFFVPYFFSMAVAAALFARVYDPSYGMLNQVIHALGFTDVKPQWLGDGKIAIYAAMGVFVWHETAFCYIVFSAAIQQIDRSLYDAAKVDGASEIQVFRFITIPSVRNVATFVMTIMLIVGLTPFAVVFPLTTPSLGGPYYATEILPTLIFKKARQGYNASEAAALGVILLILVIGILSAFLWFRERTAPRD